MNNGTDVMVVFRKAGKGYNRDDVNKYIEEMNIRFKNESDALKSELAHLSSKEPKVTVSAEDGAELLNQIRSLSEKNSELIEENARLRDQIETLKNSVPSAIAESTDDPMASVKLKADQIVSDAEVAARLLTDRSSKHVSTMADEYEQKTLDCAIASLKELEEAFLSARVKVKEIQFRMEDSLKEISK